MPEVQSFYTGKKRLAVHGKRRENMKKLIIAVLAFGGLMPFLSTVAVAQAPSGFMNNI
jgi:hypothetical protein